MSAFKYYINKFLGRKTGGQEPETALESESLPSLPEESAEAATAAPADEANETTEEELPAAEAVSAAQMAEAESEEQNESEPASESETVLDQLILEELDVHPPEEGDKKRFRKIRTKKEHTLPGADLPATVTVRRSVLLTWGIILVILCVAATFFAADKIYFGGYYVDTSNKVTFNTENNDLYNIAKLQTVIDEIEDRFYPGVDKNVLVEGAVAGMVEALGDPFTVYYKPGTMNAYKEYITGTYEGMGAKVKTSDKGLEVTEVFAGNPAEEAGIAVGDTIVRINDEPTTEMDGERLAQILGSGGETLTLVILTVDGTEKTVKVTLTKVQAQTVYAQPEGEGIYRVIITQFDSDTGTEFYDKVTEIMEKGCRALIIDLRNNGGGYETQATKVADMLLPEGIIATAKDKNGRVIKEIQSEASALDMPVVLLVNSKTASAAELLAGAVKDFGKGKLVGTQTYGKAIGQIQIDFEQDGSGLVITTACYYTPSGKCIQGIGITPDFHVELPEEYRETEVQSIPEGRDAQLQKAMELIMTELD